MATAAASGSRFWGAVGGADSDTTSSSDSDASGRDAAPTAGAPGARHAYYESDSDSDEGGRVARSVKQRVWDALEENVRTIANHLKINNWSGLQDDFDKLNRQVEKHATLIAKEGMPTSYVRLLVNLEDAVKEVSRQDLKTMSMGNAKAYNRVKMALKKNNSNYKTQIDAYRASPEAAEAAAAAAAGAGTSSGGAASKRAAARDESESEDEVIINRTGFHVVLRKRAAPAADVEGDTDTDVEVESDSETESDEESGQLTGRERWVLPQFRKVQPVKAATAAAPAPATAAAPNVPSSKAADANAGRADAPAPAGTVDVDALQKKTTDGSAIMDKEWTADTLMARVREEVALRGRKATDVNAVAANLGALAEVSLKFGSHISIPVMMYAVTARLDTARGPDAYLDRGMWKRCCRDLLSIVNIMEANPKLRLGGMLTEDVQEMLSKRAAAAAAAAVAAAAAAGDKTTDASIAAAKKQDAAGATPNVIRVVGDVSYLIGRLHEHYMRSLQQIDSRKREYLVRINDEQTINLLADRAFSYYCRVATESRAAVSNASLLKELGMSAQEMSDSVQVSYECAARLALLRIEYLYYKPDALAARQHAQAAVADKRSEVAAIAASAAAQALANARTKALTAHRASAVAISAAATPAGAAPAIKAAADKTVENAEATRDRALAAAADVNTVSEEAADIARESAAQRGKPQFAAAAAVVAADVIKTLARQEGSLLSAGAVSISRSSDELEMIADVEAPAALDAAAVDLGLDAPVSPFDSASLMSELCAFVYARGDLRSQVRALLMCVYHHALHDRYERGHDLFMMSKVNEALSSNPTRLDAATQRLQEVVTKTDVQLMILINRALVQLGLAAFRCGLWADAFNCLAEISGSGHTRELLGQIISVARPGVERDEDAEREERRNRVPYHMHINFELVDACALFASMFLELPKIAANKMENMRIRLFGKALESMEKRTFVGPPEGVRDTVVQAGVAILDGNWRKAVDLTLGMKVWQLWTARDLEGIRERLRKQIKNLALITYLHVYYCYYDSISMKSLCDTFELEPAAAHALVSKLVYEHAIQARLDQPTECLVVHRAPLSSLQTLALELADRVSDLVDFNDRLLSARLGRISAVDEYRGREGQSRSRRFDISKLNSAEAGGREYGYRGGRDNRPRTGGGAGGGYGGNRQYQGRNTGGGRYGTSTGGAMRARENVLRGF